MKNLNILFGGVLVGFGVLGVLVSVVGQWDTSSSIGGVDLRSLALLVGLFSLATVWAGFRILGNVGK